MDCLNRCVLRLIKRVVGEFNVLNQDVSFP